MEETGMNYLWSARKRNALGLPWTFTKYAFTEDRLFVTTGLLKTASAIQENAEDIYAEAQQINEDRAAAEEVVEDTADEATEETEETTDFKEETEETEEGSEK